MRDHLEPRAKRRADKTTVAALRYRAYYRNCCLGQEFRVIARHEGVVASTILRRVRAVEHERDEGLFDRGVEALTLALGGFGVDCDGRAPFPDPSGLEYVMGLCAADGTLDVDVLRVALRLAESGARLVALPVRGGAPGASGYAVLRPVRSGEWILLTRCRESSAIALRLAGWISSIGGGMCGYRLTRIGLRHLCARATARGLTRAAVVRAIGPERADRMFTARGKSGSRVIRTRMSIRAPEVWRVLSRPPLVASSLNWIREDPEIGLSKTRAAEMFRDTCEIGLPILGHPPRPAADRDEATVARAAERVGYVMDEIDTIPALTLLLRGVGRLTVAEICDVLGITRRIVDGATNAAMEALVQAGWDQLPCPLGAPRRPVSRQAARTPAGPVPSETRHAFG